MTQKARSLKPVSNFANHAIDRLYQQIKQQNSVLAKVKASLPLPLSSHALHCVVHSDKLIIYTSSATWASQIRFHQKTVLASLAPYHSKSAPILQVKIITYFADGSTDQRRSKIIPSQGVAYEIQRQSLETTDSQLKKALQKLSATLIRLQSHH